MQRIPDELLDGPFTHARAVELGVSSRVLMGRRFIHLFPRVWCVAGRDLNFDDRVRAARLALPPDARLTGISRLQHAGLDYGPRQPLRFVVARDHHLALPGIFLHRTEKMPPSDDVTGMVSCAAAFIAYCSQARVIDAIKVGDWLLHRQFATVDEIRDLALAQLWRRGADEAIWVLPHLDAASRSLAESEARAVLDFAGLVGAVVNEPLEVEAGLVVIADLLFRAQRLFVEYEGSHHQADRDQYGRDIDRYALLRAHDLSYMQVTKEKLARPRILVGEVYRALLARGYDGPPPELGDAFRALFSSVRAAVGDRPQRRRAS